MKDVLEIGKALTVLLPFLLSGSVPAEEQIKALPSVSSIAVQNRMIDWVVPPNEEPNLRQLGQDFKFQMLPNLKLKGRLTTEAVNILGQHGFQCTFVDEMQDIIYPDKYSASFIDCMRWYSQTNRIIGWESTYLHMHSWEGDRTPLSKRYDQFFQSEVELANSGGAFYYEDNREAPDNITASRLLDQKLVFAQADQPMPEVVKYAMLNKIACRAVASEKKKSETLECSTFNKIPECHIALISIELSPVEGSNTPLSLWSQDRVVKGPQGPWVCLNGSY